MATVQVTTRDERECAECGWEWFTAEEARLCEEADRDNSGMSLPTEGDA